MDASVLLSTYNQTRFLELVLLAYTRQTTRSFEIVVADDGSRPETRELVERMARDYPVPLRHVWHEDQGFRKARIMNRAALASRGQCLISTDGDCLPAATFVEEHLEASAPETYAVGGHIRLTKEVTEALTPEIALSGEYEKYGTAAEKLGLWGLHAKSLVYVAFGKRRKPKLYGLNFSVDRATFERLNGFDQSYENYAKDDSDLRNRMQLAGVRARSLWHRARVFHMHHKGNSSRLVWKDGLAYYNRADLAPAAPVGLRELAAELELSEAR